MTNAVAVFIAFCLFSFESSSNGFRVLPDPITLRPNTPRDPVISIEGVDDHKPIKTLIEDLEKTMRNLEVLKKAISEHIGSKPEKEESTSISIPYKKKQYYFGKFFKANFYNAGLYCKHRGMELASIASAEEHERLETVINNVVAECITGPIWTSGSNSGTEGQFVWSSGSPISYSKWDKREPLVSDSSNCLAIYKTPVGYRWYSKICSDEYYFVCEYYNHENCQ